MEVSKLPDWRIHLAAEVANVSGANPMGAQPGDVVLLIAETRTPEEGRVCIPVVSPCRLALSIAIRAATEAKVARKFVKFEAKPRMGRVRSIDFLTTPALFDFFEQCMIAATFSYQALETYSNQVIEEQLRDGATLELERRKGGETFDAASLQRDVSTEEKIASVLPLLLKIPFPKSGKLWQQFTILRRVRDSIIHLKSEDHHIRGAFDKESVFFKLLNNDPRLYPRVALGLMRLYAGGQLNWLAHAEEHLEKSKRK